MIVVLLAHAAAAGPLVLDAGQPGGTAGLELTRRSSTAQDSTVYTTEVDASVLGAYGLTPWLAAGARYTLPVYELSGAGEGAVFAAVPLAAHGRWEVAASLLVSVDLDADHRTAVEVGLAARYHWTDEVALFTGTPWSPGPTGKQMQIEFGDAAYRALELPVGIEVTASCRVTLDLATTLWRRVFSGAGGSSSFVRETPVTAGAWIAITPLVSVRIAVGTTDLQERDDFAIGALVRVQPVPDRVLENSASP